MNELKLKHIITKREVITLPHVVEHQTDNQETGDETGMIIYPELWYVVSLKTIASEEVRVAQSELGVSWNTSFKGNC